MLAAGRQALAVHARRQVAGKEDDRLGNLLGPSRPAHRLTRDELLERLRRTGRRCRWGFIARLGATALTRTPVPSVSTAATRVGAITAALAAE
jgi:hypothetical protein